MILRRPLVLIAGERYGHGRDAFIREGCVAFSCDTAPSEAVGPHYQDDWENVIPLRFWDLIIIHPVCTALSVSGNHVYAAGKARHQDRLDSAAYVERLWKLCRAYSRFTVLENPRGVIATMTGLGKASQTVQPYDFGHDASKATDLWEAGLPRLAATSRVSGRMVEWPRGSGKMVERWANQTDSGQNKLGPDKAGEEGKRAMLRAESYPGIMAAAAQTWTPYLGTA